MSTKSSSKFWKKLGLGKKSSSNQVSRPPSLQSHATTTTNTLLTHHDDTLSNKSKRLSGVLPNRKQSTNSMKRLHQTAAVRPDAPTQPALPATDSTLSDMKIAHTSNNNDTPWVSPPPPPPSSSDTTSSTFGSHVEHIHQSNHVELKTPPVDLETVNKRQQEEQEEEQQKEIELTFDVITHEEVRIDDRPDCMTVESNMNSRSTANQHPHTSLTEQPSSPRPNNTPSRLLKPRSGSSLKKASQSHLLSSSTTTTPSPSTQTKSRLRQPSAPMTNTTTPGASSTSTPSASSSSSSLRKESVTSHTPPPPLPSQLNTVDDKDLFIQKLQEALQTEQSINRVLQGQKEAITRDLDYFSLTVDELMEEKEALLQKYEEEKLKTQSKEEDLNVLLDKLKTSTDNARERSMEVDHLKNEIEHIKEEASLEQKELKSILKRKDQDIIRLKSDVAKATEEITTLSSRLNQLMEESSQRKLPSNPAQSPTHPQHHHTSLPSAIETPSASPRLDAQQMNEYDVSGNSDTSSLPSSYHEQQQPLGSKSSTSRYNHDMKNGLGSISLYNNHRSPAMPMHALSSPSINALDDELMMLTKEKEKLQSDYSKIPLSGGGPTSRRRKEQLEEMLDEVDSQLSKVKQKIRRS